MSNSIKSQDTENSNESIKWIEEAIAHKHIKYYDNKDFNNIREIGSGGFGKIYRASWKTSGKFFVLKTFFNRSNVTVRDIVDEVNIASRKYLL